MNMITQLYFAKFSDKNLVWIVEAKMASDMQRSKLTSLLSLVKEFFF